MQTISDLNLLPYLKLSTTSYFKLFGFSNLLMFPQTQPDLNVFCMVLLENQTLDKLLDGKRGNAYTIVSSSSFVLLFLLTRTDFITEFPKNQSATSSLCLLLVFTFSFCAPYYLPLLLLRLLYPINRFLVNGGQGKRKHPGQREEGARRPLPRGARRLRQPQFQGPHQLPTK